MRGAQNPVNDVEIPGGDFDDHMLDKIGPILREILATNEGDGVGKLTLNLL